MKMVLFFLEIRYFYLQKIYMRQSEDSANQSQQADQNKPTPPYIISSPMCLLSLRFIQVQTVNDFWSYSYFTYICTKSSVIHIAPTLI